MSVMQDRSATTITAGADASSAPRQSLDETLRLHRAIWEAWCAEYHRKVAEHIRYNVGKRAHA